MNLEKEDWWNHVFATIRDKIEMSLFVTRYVCSLLVFVLGLKAPGIASNLEDDYIHLENETNTVNEEFLFYNLPRIFCKFSIFDSTFLY